MKDDQSLNNIKDILVGDSKITGKSNIEYETEKNSEIMKCLNCLNSAIIKKYLDFIRELKTLILKHYDYSEIEILLEKFNL